MIVFYCVVITCNYSNFAATKN